MNVPKTEFNSDIIVSFEVFVLVWVTLDMHDSVRIISLRKHQ